MSEPFENVVITDRSTTSFVDQALCSRRRTELDCSCAVLSDSGPEQRQPVRPRDVVFLMQRPQDPVVVWKHTF